MNYNAFVGFAAFCRAAKPILFYIYVLLLMYRRVNLPQFVPKFLNLPSQHYFVFTANTVYYF